MKYIIKDTEINAGADAHVGQPETDGEELIITVQRESFKWGAIWMAEQLEKRFGIEIFDNEV